MHITNIDDQLKMLNFILKRANWGFCFEEILQIHTLIGEQSARQGETLNSNILHTRGHVGREDQGIEEQNEKWDEAFPHSVEINHSFLHPFLNHWLSSHD